MPPSIAVITPVRNGLPYLRESIQSILAQQHSNLEIIVVDDASTDGSADLARSMGCRVLHTPGIGPAGARNAGIRASQSDLLLFLDADDLAAPSALHNMLDALLRTPGAGLAQGCIQNFNATPAAPIHLISSPYRFVNLGSALWRRSLFETVGLFDESLRLGEDQDLLMRCWERDIPKALVNSVTLYYRRHAGNMTRGLNGSDFGLMRVYRNRIERIRRGQYDPRIPKHITWADYLGKSPAVEDPA